MASPSEPTGACRSLSSLRHPSTCTAFRATFGGTHDARPDIVPRWIRTLGIREADREDIAEDVFLVVRRQIDASGENNPARRLYQITRRQFTPGWRRLHTARKELLALVAGYQRGFQAAGSGRERKRGGGLMGTIDDDSFALPGRLLTGSPVASAQPAWVRTRAIDLLRSLDEFRVPTGRKQRLLLRLRPGSPRTFALLLPIVVGAFLMGIGGGIATAALTEWPARVVRSYRKLLSTPSHSGAFPSALPPPSASRWRRWAEPPKPRTRRAGWFDGIPTRAGPLT